MASYNDVICSADADHQANQKLQDPFETNEPSSEEGNELPLDVSCECSSVNSESNRSISSDSDENSPFLKNRKLFDLEGISRRQSYIFSAAQEDVTCAMIALDKALNIYVECLENAESDILDSTDITDENDEENRESSIPDTCDVIDVNVKKSGESGSPDTCDITDVNVNSKSSSPDTCDSTDVNVNRESSVSDICDITKVNVKDNRELRIRDTCDVSDVNVKENRESNTPDAGKMTHTNSEVKCNFKANGQSKKGVKRKKKSRLSSSSVTDVHTLPQRPGIEWKIGEALKAKDRLLWYDAKIVDIDLDMLKVKIHYLNWNKRYDMWLSMMSENIQPSEVKSSGTKIYKQYYEGCTKSFCEETLLTSHLKYYHGEQKRRNDVSNEVQECSSVIKSGIVHKRRYSLNQQKSEHYTENNFEVENTAEDSPKEPVIKKDSKRRLSLKQDLQREHVSEAVKGLDLKNVNSDYVKVKKIEKSVKKPSTVKRLVNKSQPLRSEYRMAKCKSNMPMRTYAAWKKNKSEINSYDLKNRNLNCHVNASENSVAEGDDGSKILNQGAKDVSLNTDFVSSNSEDVQLCKAKILNEKEVSDVCVAEHDVTEFGAADLATGSLFDDDSVSLFSLPFEQYTDQNSSQISDSSGTDFSEVNETEEITVGAGSSYWSKIINKGMYDNLKMPVNMGINKKYPGGSDMPSTSSISDLEDQSKNDLLSRDPKSKVPKNAGASLEKDAASGGTKYKIPYPSEIGNMESFERDDLVRCICNSIADVGEMVQCDFCKTWQHSACFNIKCVQQDKEHVCHNCRRSKVIKETKDKPDVDWFSKRELPFFKFSDPASKNEAEKEAGVQPLMKIVDIYNRLGNLQTGLTKCKHIYDRLKEYYDYQAEPAVLNASASSDLDNSAAASGIIVPGSLCSVFFIDILISDYFAERFAADILTEEEKNIMFSLKPAIRSFLLNCEMKVGRKSARESEFLIHHSEIKSILMKILNAGSILTCNERLCASIASDAVLKSSMKIKLERSKDFEILFQNMKSGEKPSLDSVFLSNEEESEEFLESYSLSNTENPDSSKKCEIIGYLMLKRYVEGEDKTLCIGLGTINVATGGELYDLKIAAEKENQDILDMLQNDLDRIGVSHDAFCPREVMENLVSCLKHANSEFTSLVAEIQAASDAFPPPGECETGCSLDSISSVMKEIVKDLELLKSIEQLY